MATKPRGYLPVKMKSPSPQRCKTKCSVRVSSCERNWEVTKEAGGSQASSQGRQSHVLGRAGHKGSTQTTDSGNEAGEPLQTPHACQGSQHQGTVTLEISPSWANTCFLTSHKPHSHLHLAPVPQENTEFKTFPSNLGIWSEATDSPLSYLPPP